MLDVLGGLINAGTGIGNAIAGNKLAEENYQNQLAQQDYMKHVQQTTWQREDNSIQRRVADLKAAGLSPVLAAGSGAQSSAPIQVNAPQKSYTPVNVDTLGMMQTTQQIAQTKSQTDLNNITAEEKAYNLKKYKEMGITTDSQPFIKTLMQGVNALDEPPKKGTALGNLYDSLFDRNAATENGFFSPANMPIIGPMLKKRSK